MTKRFVLAAALLLLWSAGAFVQGQVTFKQGPNKIDVEIAGEPFTTFYYDRHWPKPFLHPLRLSSGTIITRGFPLEKIEGESNDHFWHRGLWFAHGDINGVDFWREASGDEAKDSKLPLPIGRIVAKAPPKTDSGKNEGKITAEFNLVTSEKKVIGTLRQQYIFRRVGQNNIIDFQAAILADQGISLKLGDTEEGLLGVRFADEFRQDRGAILSYSEGLKGTENRRET